MRESDRTPPHLYKYRSLAGEAAGHVADILRNNRLFWTPPERFNDPFDTQPVIIARAKPAEKTRRIRTIIANARPNASKATRKELLRSMAFRSEEEVARAARGLQAQLRRDIGICSLAARPDVPLMWSHYADSHRGICLEFSARLPIGPNPFLFALPVIYTDDRPVLNMYRQEKPGVIIDKVILTKASYWAYEEEWRLVGQELGPGLYPFMPAALTRVILGAAMTTPDREQVIDWCKKRAVPVRLAQAVMSDEHYRIEVLPLA